MTDGHGKRAVVLGASIAGLLAARVLGRHFGQVLVLERDELPADTSPGPRPGTAQGHHAHVLLRRGLSGMEALLPGFVERLTSSGAVLLDAGRDWAAVFPQGDFPRFDAGLEFICASRWLMEHAVRNLVLAQHDNIVVRDHCQVLSVALSATQAPRIRIEDRQTRIREELVADLVIDATGRNSAAEKWLAQSGFGPVATHLTKPLLGYATCVYEGIESVGDARAALVMARDPDMPRGGVLFPVEGNRHICTLYGFGDHPPTGDLQGYLDFAASLRSDIIFQAIRHARPVQELKSFRKDESVFRDYAARQTGWPAGFLVTGDAVASINPIYGQGMTSAVLAAENLDRLLQRDMTAGWSRAAQRAIVDAMRKAWKIAASEDLRWPEPGQQADMATRLNHRIADAIGRAASVDRQVTMAYMQVLHMLQPPESMLMPSMLFRIWRGSRRVRYAASA